jgi:Domain of unknown function (DUF4160)
LALRSILGKKLLKAGFYLSVEFCPFMMVCIVPVILRYKDYKFFFFANEGMPREPLHVHVRKGEATAKFWVKPDVILAETYAMTSGELKELLEVVKKNEALIERSWNEFFGSETTSEKDNV